MSQKWGYASEQKKINLVNREVKLQELIGLIKILKGKAINSAKTVPRKEERAKTLFLYNILYNK